MKASDIRSMTAGQRAELRALATESADRLQALLDTPKGLTRKDQATLLRQLFDLRQDAILLSPDGIAQGADALATEVGELRQQLAEAQIRAHRAEARAQALEEAINALGHG